MTNIFTESNTVKQMIIAVTCGGRQPLSLAPFPTATGGRDAAAVSEFARERPRLGRILRCSDVVWSGQV